ncbi:HWE histidine kinase domain-containing protein [Methyloligella sp. 2.7D]|uniref:HWE histidine kinase domain-containing protein n=1 Tax=unclassified Methyloligella TaxID=2625955 RepID=UPI00157C6031|nr:HWE histidine kinase domain-containing protein [Methyloligella sp. GL2]QKP77969.1 PAS domain S-box protein [Methyloligella sp. GL2]
MTDVPINLPLPMPRGKRISLGLARACAIFAILIGAAVLASWRLDDVNIRDYAGEMVTMRPDAAVAVVLSGVALLCFSFSFRVLRVTARLLAMPVIAVAILILFYDMIDLRSGLNEVLMSPATPVVDTLNTQETQRLALGIGLAILLFGLALAAAARGRFLTWLSQVLAIALLVQVLVVLTGYAYGITSAYHPFPFSALSVDGAASALLLGVGLLAATPDDGLAAAVLERSPAGEMLRRLLPGILVLPLVTGWLAHQAELSGFYDSAASFALFAVASVVVLAVFSWTTTNAVRRADEVRNEALYELRRQREWLQITLSSIGEGVIATDARGKVLIINKVAEDMTGWMEEEARGRHISKIFRVVDEESRKTLPDPATAALTNGGLARHETDSLLITKDGSELPVEDVGAPIYGSDGSLTGAVLIFRDVTEPRRAAQRQTMLVGELNHRVKNSLAIVQSLVQASLRQADSAPAMAMAATLGERLRALHRAHDLLLESQWSGASLKAMVERELEPYCREDGPQIVMKGPDVLLPPSCTSIFAMTLHELATNAVKYGALSQNEGQLEVTWRRRGKRLRLTWKEKGSAPPPQPGGGGFGTQLIEKGIRHNLGGETKLEFRPEGLYVDLNVPLETESAPKPATRRQITSAERETA